MSPKAPLDDFLVRSTATLRAAAACINQNRSGCALVVDEDRRLVRTLTDGDLRRALLAGKSLDAPLEAAFAIQDQVGHPAPVTAEANITTEAATALMRKHVIRQLPLVDDRNRVVGVRLLEEQRDIAPVRSAVIFAGGFGTRLRPLTNDTPKPMVSVGDRPVMQHIVEQLRDQGIERLGVTTHFMPEKIEQHFGDGQRFGVELSYVREDEPLGTAGALGLLPRPSETTLVMNGDILSRVDIGAMTLFHREHEAAITVAARQFDMAVPYGVLECRGPDITSLQEKPRLSFLVNAGIYLIEPTCFDFIPTDRRFDMTDLIETAIEKQLRVVSFPLVEYWIDIGRQEDLEQARREFEKDGQHEPQG